jgi:hypothetical protein
MAPETLTRTFAKLQRKEIIRIVEDGVDLLEIGQGRSRAKQRPPGFMEGCA